MTWFVLASLLFAAQPPTIEIRSRLSSGIPDNKTVALIVVRDAPTFSSDSEVLHGLLRQGLILDRVWPLQPNAAEWSRGVGIQSLARTTDVRPVLGPALKEARGKAAGEDVAYLRRLLEQIRQQPLDRADNRRQDILVVEVALVERLARLAKDEASTNEMRLLLADIAFRQNMIDLAAKDDTVQAYNAVRQELKAAVPGQIEWLGVPAGAALSIDGQPPQPVLATHSSLPPGDHEVCMVTGLGEGRFRTGLTRIVRVRSAVVTTVTFAPEVELNLRVNNTGASWSAGADASSLAQFAYAEQWSDVTWVLSRKDAQHIEVEVFGQPRFAGEPRPIKSGMGPARLGRVEWEQPQDVRGLGPVIYALGCTLTFGEVCEVSQTLPSWTERQEGSVWVMSPGTRVVEATPVYKKWWFWTLIGGAALAAGAGTTAYVLSRPTDQVNYQFTVREP